MKHQNDKSFPILLSLSLSLAYQQKTLSTHLHHKYTVKFVRSGRRNEYKRCTMVHVQRNKYGHKNWSQLGSRSLPHTAWPCVVAIRMIDMRALPRFPSAKTYVCERPWGTLGKEKPASIHHSIPHTPHHILSQLRTLRQKSLSVAVLQRVGALIVYFLFGLSAPGSPQLDQVHNYVALNVPGPLTEQYTEPLSTLCPHV